MAKKTKQVDFNFAGLSEGRVAIFLPEWRLFSEVSKDGRAITTDSTDRMQRPLDYYRRPASTFGKRPFDLRLEAVADGDEFLIALASSVHDLFCGFTAGLKSPLRGFVLNQYGCPATIEDLALISPYSIKNIGYAIQLLIAAGLVVLRTWPPPQPEDNEEYLRKQRSAAKCARVARCAGSAKRAKAAPKRKRKAKRCPSDSGKRENEKRKKTVSGKIGEGEGENLPAVFPPGKTKLKLQRKVIKIEDATAGGCAAAPATTPNPPGSAGNPTTPTDPDARGEARPSESATASPPSVFSHRIDNRKLERLYDPTCQQFAVSVFSALSVPYSPDSAEGRSELGCFGSLWASAQQSGLPPSALDELWSKSLAEAAALAKKRRRQKWRKNPQACWVSIFQKRLNAARDARREQIA